jgi:hypothetical protein
MMSKSVHLMNRRGILKGSAATLGSALLASEPMEAYPKGVNSNSSPSQLKITDLRVATVVKPGPGPCPIIRVDTNQGVYGLGEVRDGASPTFALKLKSRFVGENPLQVDRFLGKSSNSADQRYRRAAFVLSKWRFGISRAKSTACQYT